MLVLNRGKNESVCIGREIRVVIVDVRGNHVRLGIDAPREVPVHREEVAKTIWGDLSIGGAK